ncbi:MAG: hypothetical protein JOY62_09560 [Acidobacteriaceae bacterium]|nr:hypothetical protein [Acidobacteriaceae bacterium]MBV9780206.1 hypothetical protein [Acidobacteriaceae bacterium]
MKLIFKEINGNRTVTFGIVSGLCLAAMLAFDKKPELGFVAVISIAGGAALLRSLDEWRRGCAARRWMRVQAQLESGTQAEIRGRRRVYSMQVSYSYSIQGSCYGGFYEAYFHTEEEAIKLLEELKRNPFWIRVNPTSLDESRLILEER